MNCNCNERECKLCWPTVEVQHMTCTRLQGLAAKSHAIHQISGTVAMSVLTVCLTKNEQRGLSLCSCHPNLHGCQIWSTILTQFCNTTGRESGCLQKPHRAPLHLLQSAVRTDASTSRIGPLSWSSGAFLANMGSVNTSDPSEQLPCASSALRRSMFLQGFQVRELFSQLLLE